LADNTYNDQPMPLLDHLIELRQRLLWSVVALAVGFGVCFIFSEELYNFLVDPLAQVMLEKDLKQGYRRLIFTDLTEVFFTYIKVSFFFGAFITCPIFLTQIWLFVAPGLYKNERTALLPFLIASPILFFTGGALVYYGIFPLAWEFFISFETGGSGPGEVPIQLEPKVNEYLSLVMKLIFAFGLCFQLPVLMTLLARVGLATSDGMKKKRKYAIVGVFGLAAIFTPPDPLSQIGLALPIIILYEISIWMARLMEKKREAEEAAVDEDLGGGDQ
jgi:sec-independent protein translocase protein TatC